MGWGRARLAVMRRCRWGRGGWATNWNRSIYWQPNDRKWAQQHQQSRKTARNVMQAKTEETVRSVRHTLKQIDGAERNQTSTHRKWFQHMLVLMIFCEGVDNNNGQYGTMNVQWDTNSYSSRFSAQFGFFVFRKCAHNGEYVQWCSWTTFVRRFDRRSDPCFRCAATLFRNFDLSIVMFMLIDVRVVFTVAFVPR